MRALGLPLLPFFVLVSACGGGSSTEQAQVNEPVVEVASGPEAPPLPAQGPEDGAFEVQQAKSPSESIETCFERVREGRGLPGRAAASPEAQDYAQALAHERAGNMNDARKGYLRFIQTFPQSPHVPLVYFAFGELFYREADVDPMKLDLALQSYREVMKFPPPANTAYIAAHLRLADVYMYKGNHVEALATLKRMVEASTKEPTAECAAVLAAPARNRMVTVYSHIGRPDVAFEFFRRSSGDRGDDRTNALAMVASLAEIYLGQQKHGEVATALLSANANSYDVAFCRREEDLLAKSGASLAPTRRQELSQAHAQRCVAR